MKLKKIPLILLPIVAIILEALPYGVVLNFGNPDGEPWRRVYSYFSMVPFGYANFGPLICAILTCSLLLLAVIYFIKPKNGLYTAILNISGFAAAASLMPILFGMEITLLAVVITILLAGNFAIALLQRK